jgi:hypothetical protein
VACILGETGVHVREMKLMNTKFIVGLKTYPCTTKTITLFGVEHMKQVQYHFSTRTSRPYVENKLLGDIS